MRDSATLQQSSVSGQQDPLLAEADIGEGLVVGVTGPPHVEPEHSKQPRQPTGVDVDDEARITQRRRPQPGRGPDVERLEHRVHRDAVAGTRPVRKILRIPVNQDEVDLGMRNAQRLQNVLDRLMRPKRTARRYTARLGSQEVVELGVGPDVHIARHSSCSPARAPCAIFSLEDPWPLTSYAAWRTQPPARSGAAALESD